MSGPSHGGGRPHSAGDRLAAVAWSAIVEPLDGAAHGLISRFGYAGALAWLRGVGVDPVGATMDLACGPAEADAIIKGVPRWSARLPGVDAHQLMATVTALGARVILPSDAEWPRAFGESDAFSPTGLVPPLALFARGPCNLSHAWERSLALVGARASTAYGNHVASLLAAAAADRGLTVISGGAYGIDAAAHRAVLTQQGTTVAVLAGGIDRLYPAGNSGLLEAVMSSGAVVSEQPPGFAPYRARFLSRNRLIAAATATVVVEAAYRSGAMSTAYHAAAMGRPVGAVPGPVTQASSAGCHRLIKDGAATLVANAEDALMLALPLGSVEEAAEPVTDQPDFLTGDERRVYGAIGSRGSTVDRLAIAAGMDVGPVQVALGSLSLRALVSADCGTWRRAPGSFGGKK